MMRKLRNIALILLILALPLGAQSQVLDLFGNKVLVDVNDSYQTVNLNGYHLHLVNSQIDVNRIKGIGKISGDDKSKIHSPYPIAIATDLEIAISTSPVSDLNKTRIKQSNVTYEWVANGNTLLLIRSDYQAIKVVIKHEGKQVKVIDSRPRNTIMISVSDLPLNLNYDIHVLGMYEENDCFTIKR